MPGGFGTIDTPWGAGGTTSTAGPYSAPGGNQGGPGHPGGYNPNLNPPVTVDYTSHTDFSGGSTAVTTPEDIQDVDPEW